MASITLFARCPRCDDDKYNVEVRMDRENQIGVALCLLCGKKYEKRIHARSKPIKVYSAWIDRVCRRRNEERNRTIGGSGA